MTFGSQGDDSATVPDSAFCAAFPQIIHRKTT
jgi:hypothetical protein